MPSPSVARNITWIRSRDEVASRLERRGEVNRERARTDDTGQSRRPVHQVTFVLITIGLEVLRHPDRGVLVDVRLAVAQAELVDVASLAASPARVTRRRRRRRQSLNLSRARALIFTSSSIFFAFARPAIVATPPAARLPAISRAR